MTNLFIFLNTFVNRILRLLGLRRQEGRWGIVYDSVNKQPLDPVQVQLIDAHTGKLVQSCVSDLSGRYNFLSFPGKFKILVKKSNYIYPSAIVTGQSDGVYGKLYHGEFFELTEDSDVIPFNIPMDPVAKDWNQGAKADLVSFHPLAEKLLHRLTMILFWFVLALALAELVFYRSSAVYGVLAFYGLVFLLALIVPGPRWWGRVVLKDIDENPDGLVVELSYHQMPDVVVVKAAVTAEGKFLLRMEPGKYILRIRKVTNDGAPSVLYARNVRIGLEQVVNRDFVI